MKKNTYTKFLTIALSSAMALSAINTTSVFANDRVVRVQINSTQAVIDSDSITLDAAPYIDNSNTMIPIRFIANALDISDDKIEFEPHEKRITINNNGTVISFAVGSNSMDVIYSNGTTTVINMDNNAKAQIVDSRTFLPFRAVAEVFGLDVDWEANTKTVILTSKNHNGSSDLTNDSYNDVTTNDNVVTEQTDTTTTETDKEEETTTVEFSELARTYEEEVIRLVNIEREAEGIDALVLYEPAMDLARKKSQDMADRNYFSHSDEDDVYMYKELDNASSENIAANHKTAEAVVNAWMNSAGHKANILNASNVGIGVGVVEGNADSDWDYYWTQIFVRSIPEEVEEEKEEEVAPEEETTDENETTNDDVTTEEEATPNEDEVADENETPKEDETTDEEEVTPNEDEATEENITTEDTQNNETETVSPDEIIDTTTNTNTNNSATTNNNTTTTNTAVDVRAYEEEVVRLVNIERAKEGLEPLELFEPAMDLARAKSQHMSDNKYFSHEDSNGNYMFHDLKTYASTLAENIASGQRTPAEAINSWMNSTGHRENILNKNFKYIGVGFVQDSYMWTQMFLGTIR